MRKTVLVAVAMALAVPAFSAVQASSIGALDRSVEPVVMTGAQFPTWSAGADPTLREPQAPGDPLGGTVPADSLHSSDCAQQNGGQVEEDGTYDHNCYQSSRLPRNPLQGAPVDRILGYKWNGSGFEQIPFQVDERFVRYISNNQSGFAPYSGVDQYDTYAFDREGFRYTYDQAYQNNGVGNQCLAVPRPGSPALNAKGFSASPDPVKGLDNNDELVFMERDAGAEAPSTASLPAGIDSTYKVAVADPANPSAAGYVYVALASAGGPSPQYTEANSPYVRYQRDANAGTFVYSQSSYDGYGNAPKGPYCHADGTPDTSHGLVAQRRPIDTAWVSTPRYKFRYEGRWMMTELHASNAANGDWTYGPDLVDRWKARAFAQDPGSDTPCCGYEEEDTNWGGSSILFGERAGPVRAIREAWGADSSTNNAKRETFYRDSIDFGDALRVHVIPPLDGIYVQWDHNAGQADEYYNPSIPNGIAIDGSNSHEAFGNFDDACNTDYDTRQYNGQPHRYSDLDAQYRAAYKSAGICGKSPYHQSVDVVDLTQNNPEGTLQWEQVTGRNGTLVSRWTVRDVTPGGTTQGLVAAPYYRDDSCFDDGTGTNPGPKVNLRSANEPPTWGVDPVDGIAKAPAPAGSTPVARVCWSPGKPLDPDFSPQGDIRYYQGSIATHGLHLMFVAESDNADMTVPLTEIDSVQHMVVRPGCDVAASGAACNVGEAYGRTPDFPLQTVATPLDATIAVSP